MRAFRHCPWCGAPLQPPVGSCQRCGACGQETWLAAKPCGCGIVRRADGRILLTRRAREPFAGLWDVPGGFVEPFETPEQCVVRELAEETGLEVRVERYVAAVVDRYGAGGDQTLNLFFTCSVVGGIERPDDDVSELGWFTPAGLPLDELAFDNGAAGLRAYLAT